MSTDITEEKRGISRRDLIKKGAVAGAVVWTVPFIESVPAYASTGSMPFDITCSYIVLVYMINNSGPYAVNLSGNQCGPNATSSDATFSTTCNGSTYDNANYGPVRKDSTVIPNGDCSTLLTYFTFSGNTITAKAGSGATILFSVAHNGSFQGPPSSEFYHFSTQCGTASYGTSTCTGS